MQVLKESGGGVAADWRRDLSPCLPAVTLCLAVAVTSVTGHKSRIPLVASLCIRIQLGDLAKHLARES